jgi:hypothetical protein
MILIVREVTFLMREKHIIGDFEDFFQWAKTFLTLKLSRGQRLLLVKIRSR